MPRNSDAAAPSVSTSPCSAKVSWSTGGGSLNSTRNVIVPIAIWLSGRSSKVAVTRSACSRNAASRMVTSWLNLTRGSNDPPISHAGPAFPRPTPSEFYPPWALFRRGATSHSRRSRRLPIRDTPPEDRSRSWLRPIAEDASGGILPRRRVRRNIRKKSAPCPPPRGGDSKKTYGGLICSRALAPPRRRGVSQPRTPGTSARDVTSCASSIWRDTPSSA